MRKDEGHEETDRLLAELEKKIAREYAQASRETQEKLDDYLRRFEIKDEKWQIMVANGTKSAAEYKKWRVGQIMVGQKWEALRDQLARDYHNSNMVARSMVQGYMPEVYAINHNFATYQIEKEAKVDTSFTLYDRQTVERIIRDEPDLLPPPGPRMKASLAEKKDIAWQKGQIQSVTLQSILQGESIPNMSKRIARTMGETNHKSTIRYARTAATGAQNAGRQDAYKRAEKMGIDMEREWVATLDNRTRHEHRQLDGQVRGVDEPFEVDGLEIMYPGDPTAEGHLIWNCRCTTVAKVKGWEDISGQTRSSEAIGGMSYEEWKEGHSQPRRITAQEEAGEAARQGYIAEYRAVQRQEKVDNPEDNGIMGMHHAMSVEEDRSEFHMLSDEELYDLISEELEDGAAVMRNDPDWNRRLKDQHSTAVTIGDAMIFGPDVCLTDVLEEKRHYRQNKSGVNDDKDPKLRELLNEIEAREWILANAERYNVPSVELKAVRRRLESYREDLEEYLKGE